MMRRDYLFAHVDSEWGLIFRNEGSAPRGYCLAGVHPAHGLLIFRRIPLWRRILGER